MKKLINLLSEFGATFLPRGKDKFPLKFISSNFPVAIKYKAGVSAQLKSAAILAGLNSYGNTIIEENLTIAMGKICFKSDQVTNVAFTFVLKNIDNELKIKVHHSSLIQ